MTPWRCSMTFSRDDLPVLHIEHKLLYPLHVATDGEAELRGDQPGRLPRLPATVSIRPVAREDCSLSVVAYGYQAELTRRVLERLAIEEELFAELLVPAQLSPVDWAPLERSVVDHGQPPDRRRVHRRLVVGHRNGGGAGLAAVRAPAPSSLRAGERKGRHPQRTRPRGRDAGGCATNRRRHQRGCGMKPVMIPTTDVNSETAIVTAWRVPDRSPVQAGELVARSRDEQGGAGRRGPRLRLPAARRRGGRERYRSPIHSRTCSRPPRRSRTRRPPGGGGHAAPRRRHPAACVRRHLRRGVPRAGRRPGVARHQRTGHSEDGGGRGRATERARPRRIFPCPSRLPAAWSGSR